MEDEAFDQPMSKRPYYSIEGIVRSEDPLENMRLILLGRGLHGRGLRVPVEANEALTNYVFDLPQLKMGDYDLEVLAANRPPVTFQIALPTTEAEMEEEKGGISFSIKIHQKVNE